ncbi:hypothetical protein ACIPUC_01015 [Streptomyces sp. LARHCF249]
MPRSIASESPSSDSRGPYVTDWPAVPADTVTELALPALDAAPAFRPKQVQGIYHDNALRLIPAVGDRLSIGWCTWLAGRPAGAVG